MDFIAFLDSDYPNSKNAKDSLSFLKCLSNKLFNDNAFLKAEEINQKQNLINAFNAIKAK